MLVDLVQLRTFVVVAEEQHLTRAAERLSISLSAASNHVRAIEEILDMQLFERTNRCLMLTRAGEILFREARTLLNDASRFTSLAREMRGKCAGNLVMGASGEPGARLGAIVSALQAQQPLVTVDLRARASAATLQELKTGELDLGMLLGRPLDPTLTYYELATVKFRIAGPAAWEARIRKADWAELAALPWITPTEKSSSHAAMLAELFDARGLQLNTIVRYDNASLARPILDAGVGMMLLREDLALQAERDGSLALSPSARAEFSLLIAHGAGRRSDPLIRAFVEAARTAWPEMKEAAATVRR